ncbi:MAG: NAD(P)H-quinone oxidoreductase [Actinomycetales bacterium]|nr:NAD(P)H-quinone oxidoreductase [Actinomycetales bacterium]
MTSTMHAVIASEPGGPEVLRWQEVPVPVPGPGEVLIRVAASAANRADLLQRQGLYPPPPGASDIIGLECSGTITEVGAGVTSHRPGDEVVALLAGGGYAEFVAVPAGQLMSVPTPISLIDAAALPEVACTVWSNLVMVGGMHQGQWLLVHGGGSGIGTFAIQLARAMGVRVAVTAGSQAKLQACAQLGAEVLIDYREQDFVEACLQATSGAGVDLILDNMGAAYLERNVRALARNGHLLVIGLQGGITAQLDLNAMLRKNASVHAMSLRGRPESEKAEICAQVDRQVWPWVQAGLIAPVIGARLPLHEASRAHQLLQDGEVTGKVLLIADE